jgi:hypothetical protein
LQTALLDMKKWCCCLLTLGFVQFADFEAQFVSDMCSYVLKLQIKWRSFWLRYGRFARFLQANCARTWVPGPEGLRFLTSFFLSHEGL